jgi:hypothetical protein
MASIVYSLCALTSILCAVLLLAKYRRRGERLLLWSALGFCGLAVNNLLLFSDFVLVPDADLSLYRSVAAAGALVLMLTGLIWDGC